MKSLLLSLLCIFTFTLSVSAQSTALMVKHGQGGSYLEHKVAPKEGLYSIGRIYNVHPKHIASFNNLDLNSGLSIGQNLQIPLSDTNFTQQSNNGTPVYYMTSANEGLQKVSSANNKVSLQNLRSWNNLKSDNLKSGSKLIVGYLLTNQPVVANNTNTKPVEEEVVTAKTEKPVEKTEKPVEKTEKPVEKTEKPAEKVVEMKPEPKETQTVAAPVKEEPKKTEPAFTKNDNSASTEGYFRPHFNQQVRSTPASKNTTVTSGVFKTNSGWQDAKYYLLIDGVPTGSIIKVVNPENNKAVYAKVLGEMNGIRQNQGLGIRISNAAAAALGVGESEKFVVKLNY